MNQKIEKTTIQRNWNRLAELSRKHELNKTEKAETHYRIAIQNDYAINGKLPTEFIEPKGD